MKKNFQSIIILLYLLSFNATNCDMTIALHLLLYQFYLPRVNSEMNQLMRVSPYLPLTDLTKLILQVHDICQTLT